uniref:Uncharacterized protein n=1 Tax=Panagrolaimus sp. ES5 TaxID=591445 RepID=A0AC34FQM7_9BILA
MATKDYLPSKDKQDVGFDDNLNEEEDLKKGKVNSNTTNSSTLSLHIAAYENSTESSSYWFDATKEKSLNDIIKRKNAKPIIIDSNCVIQNAFEFPRQQEEDQILHPELMAFKASQTLLNPNQSPGSNDFEENNLSSDSDQICLFRKADGSFYRVDFSELRLPDDEFWEMAAGEEFDVPDVGMCTYVLSGNNDFLDERIRNESEETEEISPPAIKASRKRKAVDAESSTNSTHPTPVPLERVCELLIDNVSALSKSVHNLTQKVKKNELDLKKAQ